MKKKKILALTLAASMVFSNISWADADMPETVRETEIHVKAETVSGTATEASPSDAVKRATASNAIALIDQVEENTVELQINEGEAIHTGQPFFYSMKVGNGIPDSALVTVAIEDGAGLRHEASFLARNYRTLKKAGSLVLAAGNYTMYAFVKEGSEEKSVSDTLTFEVLRESCCYVTFLKPLTKNFGGKDPELDRKADYYTAYRLGDNQEKIDVQLLNAEYEREPGELSGEYKITRIQSPDYENIYLSDNEYAKLVIDEDSTVRDLIAKNSNPHFVVLEWKTQSVSPSRIAQSNIYRAEGDGEFVLLQSLDGWKKTYTDTTAEKGKNYRYKVTAIVEAESEGGTIESIGQVLTVTVSDREIVMPVERKMVIGTSEQAEIKFINYEQTPTGTWSSDHEGIVSVDTDGKLMAKKRGEAVITFTTEDGYMQSTRYLCIDEMTPPPSGMFNSDEWKVFTITNRNRMEEGHLPLTMVPLMQKGTDIRKDELMTKYSHTRPNGTSCFTVFDEIGFPSSRYGENIAMGQRSPADVMNSWMNSSGHYKNIMNDSYVHFATGARSNHWVQMFSGCSEDLNHMELLLPENLTFKRGTAVEDFGVIVAFNCTDHGVSYMPLIAPMCTGYDSDTEGEQAITVKYKGFNENFKITVKGGSSSGGGGGSSSGGGGGSSSGGGGGSSSGGGGGSSSGGGGGSAAGGPGSGKTGISGNTGSLPNYVIKGTWNPMADGNWKFSDSTGTPYINMWAAVENPYANTALGQQAFDWFFFDTAGNMLTGWHVESDGNRYYLNPESDGTRGKMVTGWVWIPDQNGVKKCYYFNPNSDGFRGKMMTSTIIDGYTINSNGEWTVNGVVQIQ